MSDELSFNEDWEEWDRQDNFLHHMVAGSIAGITEHTVMYPVDTFKTYVQCMRECPEAVAGRRVMEMVRGQGLLRLWRGVGTMFTGCVPAHALYFSVLEDCKVCQGVMGDRKKRDWGLVWHGERRRGVTHFFEIQATPWHYCSPFGEIAPYITCGEAVHAARLKGGLFDPTNADLNFVF